MPLEKLSGPMLDRFGIYFYYGQKNQRRNVLGSDILKRIEKYRALESAFKFSGHGPREIESDERLESLMLQLYPDISTRRKKSLIQAAAVYAIERESGSIELQDLVRAEKWTYSSFLELEKGMS
jgi:hypothetical protein